MQTTEISHNGVTFQIKYSVSVDIKVVEEQLKDRGILATEENVDAMIETIKGLDYFTTEVAEQLVNGDDHPMQAGCDVYEWAIEDNGLEPEEDD